MNVDFAKPLLTRRHRVSPAFNDEMAMVEANMTSIDILWEEASALVVNKPAGLLTQGPAGIDTLETALRASIKERDQHPGVPYVGLPHRLDRCVSGALLVARNLRAVQRFNAQFQTRKVKKTYWAIAAGNIPVDSRTGQAARSGTMTVATTWMDFMRKIPNRSMAEIVSANHRDAKQAVLHFRLVKHLETSRGLPCSWVEVELETGRMHQIRLQFASRGFPLLGDKLYGSSVQFGPTTSDDRAKAIALHARELRFHHPKTGVETVVTAPVPMGASRRQSAEIDGGCNPDGWDLITGL